MIPQALRRWWPLAAVVTLLAAVALSAAHATPQLDRVPQATPPTGAPLSPDAPEPPPEGAGPPADASGGIDIPDWLPIALGALLLLFIVAVVVLAAWRLLAQVLRRDQRATAGPDRPRLSVRAAEAEVLAAVDAGLADLSDTDADPRRAVIACWLRLEEAADAAGVPRRHTDTATDLVVRLLGGAVADPADPAGPADPADPAGWATAAAARSAAGGIGAVEAGAGGDPAPRRGRVVSADVLAGLAEVYREARYARHRIDEQMRDQARAALHRLRAELTSAVPR